MDYTEQAEQIVKLVRAYTTTHDEATELVAQALRVAHSGGMVEATKQTGNMLMETFDRVIDGITDENRHPAVES